LELSGCSMVLFELFSFGAYSTEILRLALRHLCLDHGRLRGTKLEQTLEQWDID
jgi:hypothetical protein